MMGLGLWLLAIRINVRSLDVIATSREVGQWRFNVSRADSVAFLLVMVIHGIASVVAFLQLVRRSPRYRRVLWPLVLAAVVLDAVLLGIRGAAIRAVPLTDTFEACVFLALVFGILYLLLGPALDRVWFASVMVWIIAGLVLTAALVAQPATRAQAVASTPWAVAHAATMVLAAAAVIFAAANSALYLLGSSRLKRKEVMQVLGRIPNMETLGVMNRMGLLVGFVLLTLGLASGIGLISSLGMGIGEWVADGKVICVLVVWSLLGVALILDRCAVLKEKGRACVSLVAFVLVLFAILGVVVAGVTRHQFSLSSLSTTPMWRCNSQWV